MAKTAAINVRTESEIKAQVENLYKSMGVSNAETIAAMKEADDIICGKTQANSYSSFQDMLDDALDEDAEE